MVPVWDRGCSDHTSPRNATTDHGRRRMERRLVHDAVHTCEDIRGIRLEERVAQTDGDLAIGQGGLGVHDSITSSSGSSQFDIVPATT